MLHAFRRSRLLSVLLLLASPAMAGTLLPTVHPCPVDAPWLAEHEAAPAGHYGQTHHATGQHAQICHCVGGCVAGAVATPPSPQIVGFEIAAFAPIALPSDSGGSPDQSPPPHLQPPATAPPLR